MPKVSDFPRLSKKSPKGNTIVARRPDMWGVEWSEAQNAHRARFGQATADAKAALADPDLWAIYEARAAKEKKSAFDQRDNRGTVEHIDSLPPLAV